MDKFWNKVDKTEDCWLWTAYTMPNGYGLAKTKEGKTCLAHRLSWYLEYGVWPSETIDHLCRVRHCVRVSHMEDIPLADNIRRGSAPAASAKRAKQRTHCTQRHPYSGENLVILKCRGGTQKGCLICRRAASREYQQRRRKRKVA